MTAFDFGIDFASSADRLQGEEAERLALVRRELKFNVKFLDDALGGILPNDLVLLGARTGAGKTALASLIAQENARAGKRVHYFALEAEPREIERRLKYRTVAELVYTEGSPFSRERLSYRDWYRGKLRDITGGKIDRVAEERLTGEYKTLSTYYRGKEFSQTHIERTFRAIQDKTDLIILDHLHYVDTAEDVNENRAYKDIVKSIRDISLGIGVPVILIAHLRKRDRGSKQIVPDLDDFHGTSDITKIATKVVMLAKGPRKEGMPAHLWPTYMQVAKDRMDGSMQNYIAVVPFNVRKAGYEDEYGLGRASVSGEELESLKNTEMPRWAERGVCI